MKLWQVIVVTRGGAVLGDRWDTCQAAGAVIVSH